MFNNMKTLPRTLASLTTDTNVRVRTCWWSLVVLRLMWFPMSRTAHYDMYLAADPHLKIYCSRDPPEPRIWVPNVCLYPAYTLTHLDWVSVLRLNLNLNSFKYILFEKNKNKNVKMYILTPILSSKSFFQMRGSQTFPCQGPPKLHVFGRRPPSRK